MSIEINILGGTVNVGDTVYMTASQAQSKYVLAMTITDAKKQIYPWIHEVELNNDIIVSDGGIRRLCKTKDIAEEYDSLIDSHDKLQEFFTRVAKV
jgi:hypothetical protein